MSQQEDDDEDMEFDEEALETLKLIKERTTNSNDIIVRCSVKVGEPAIDENKKKHPTYTLELIGKRGTRRSRSYRFGPLRTFDSQCRTELSSFLTVPFPANSIMSKMGGMGEAEINARAKALEKWMNDVLKNRDNMSPLLQQATAHILQLGEHQLFDDRDDDSDDEVDERGVSRERNTNPIFKSGYLLKKGKVNTAFKKRFFVLDPSTTTFLYFDSEKSYEQYIGDDQDSSSHGRGGGLGASIGSSLTRSMSFSRRISMSLSSSTHSSNTSSNGRESMSVAGGGGPLGNIQLPGATLEHVAGQQDFVIKTVESTYPLRAPSGAEAGDWATAIRAAVLNSGRAGPTRVTTPTGGQGGQETLAAQAADAEFEEVSVLLKTVGLESFSFSLSCVPGLKPGVRGVAALTDAELTKLGINENEILKLRKAIEKLDLHSTDPIASQTSDGGDNGDDDDDAAAFMAELENQEAGKTPPEVKKVEVVEMPFITLARKVLQTNPRNMTARGLIKDEAVTQWLTNLDPISFVRLNACVKSGLEIPQSMVGTYVHNACDYDDFKPLLDRIIIDCHRKKPEGNQHRVHEDTWKIDLPPQKQSPAAAAAVAAAAATTNTPSSTSSSVLDLRNVGVTEPVYMVITVVRNFTNFPFPAGMTSSQRLRLERVLCVALNKLVNNPQYGGSICSLTPSEAWKEDSTLPPPQGVVPCSYAVFGSTLQRGQAQYVSNYTPRCSSIPLFGGANSDGANSASASVSISPSTIHVNKAKRILGSGSISEDGGVFSDPFNLDPMLKSANLNHDWPIGRGVYVSQDGGIVIKYGFEDHLSITISNSGFMLSNIFEQIHDILNEILKTQIGNHESDNKNTSSSTTLSYVVHPTLGYLTSCPSNLGSGMVAEVRGLELPYYRNKYTDTKVTKDAIEFGLDVFPSPYISYPSNHQNHDNVNETTQEISDENGNIGNENDESEIDVLSKSAVNISVVRKLFIKESDIAKRIYLYISKLIQINYKYNPKVIAMKIEKEKQEQIAQQTAKQQAEAKALKILKLQEFKETLENGLRVVKFNRRGKMAFRTLLLVGDHTLTWRGDEKADKQKGSGGKTSSNSKKVGDLFDLRQMSYLQLGEEPENGGEGSGSGKPPLLGTSTLRLHVNKHKDIRTMMENGNCLCLVFKERSIDIGLDCEDQRNLIAEGFKLLLDDLNQRA